MKFMEKSYKNLSSLSLSVCFFAFVGAVVLNLFFATKSDLKHHKNKLENDPNGDFLYSVYIYIYTHIHFTLISLI